METTRANKQTRQVTLTEGELLGKVKSLFKCDSARVVTFSHTKMKYLVIGFKKSSRGKWEKHDADGIHPMNFDYLEEKTIALGTDYGVLWRRAKWFKSLEGMSVEDYLSQLTKRK